MFLRIAAEVLAMAQANQPLPPPKAPNSHVMVKKITDAADMVLALKPSLPEGIYAQLDPKKNIDEIWRTLIMKAQDVEIIVLNSENKNTTGNIASSNS